MSDHNISSDSVKRLVKDVKQALSKDLSKDGIYYKHDQNNMLIGYALIIGNIDTPYAYGNFLFKFSFPHDYPYSPPAVHYLTNDGKTRFHPNLYKNEKVCLSILNTWKGEGWTSCQSISSILITIKSILDDKPLIHEPGITCKHKDFNIYNQIIKYKTIETAVIDILSNKIYPEIFELFFNEIIENFNNNYDKILALIPNASEIYEIKTSIYRMEVKVDYNKCKKELLKIHKSIKTKIDI